MSVLESPSPLMGVEIGYSTSQSVHESRHVIGYLRPWLGNQSPVHMSSPFVGVPVTFNLLFGKPCPFVSCVLLSGLCLFTSHAMYKVGQRSTCLVWHFHVLFAHIHALYVMMAPRNSCIPSLNWLQCIIHPNFELNIACHCMATHMSYTRAILVFILQW